MVYKKSKCPFFLPRALKWEKLSQSGKAPSGGRAEIENVKYATSDIFHQEALFKFNFTFLIFGLFAKIGDIQILDTSLTNFTEIYPHV